MGSWKHRLTNVDLDARTATCEIEGEVALYVSPDKMTRRCRGGRKETKNRYAEPPAPKHRMLSRDAETRTGVCVLCGEVALSHKGGCSNVASSKRPPSLTLNDKTIAKLRLGKVCQICGGDRNLVLDHRHSTNTPRDVLCSKCNTGIGMFCDDPELLASAAKYLRKHE